MKKLTLSFTISILILTYLSAQQTPQNQATIPLTESKNRNIVLKTNLFSPIGLSLEVGLSKHFAVGTNFTYFPATELGDVTKSWGKIDFKDASKGFGFEANYYPSGSKHAAISCLKIPITTTLEIDFEQEVTVSNPMKKDEVWTNTRNIDLKREIEKRGISLKSLTRATIILMYNKINKTRCEQVDNVSAKVNGLGFKDAIFGYDTNKCANQEIITGALDVTADIKNGTPVSIQYNMKAKEDFAQAHGFTTVIAMEVEYENKQ